MWFIRPLAVCFILAFSFSIEAQDYVPGELIVKMKDSSSQGSSRFLGKAAINQKMSLKRSWKRYNIHQFQLKPGLSVEQAINDLHFDDNVEYAEPNYILRKQSTGIEGGPKSLAEIAAENTSLQIDSFSSDRFAQSNADIRAEDAWSILTTSPEKPIVAVIDSGVDYNHYVFQESGAVWTNPGESPNNSIDGDGKGFVDDIQGWNFVNNSNDPMDDDNHGTHVAGIVLGMTQDVLRNPGDLSPAKIQIMSLKFLDQSGSGTTASAIAAINYAIDNGASVLNNSWGGGHFSQALYDVIVKSNDRKLAFVAAAGNAANNNDSSPTYPASYKIANVVSVAATSSQDNLASFSNYGGQSVHVASPGISIISTLPNDSFGYSSGTSMAAPFASGLSALLVREKNQISGHQVKGVLFEYSLGVQDLLGKVASQSRIDAFEAVNFVQNTDIAGYVPNANADRWLSSVDAAETSSQAGGGCGLISTKLLQKSLQKPFDGSGGPSGGTTAALLTLLLAPLLVINILKVRAKKQPDYRRAHPRINIQSEVSIAVGGQKLIGQMSSISLGGARIDTEALLEQGGVVTLCVASPTGDKHFEVQGQIVWCEEKKAYGVRFTDSQQEARDLVGLWSSRLANKKSS